MNVLVDNESSALGVVGNSLANLTGNVSLQNWWPGRFVDGLPDGPKLAEEVE